MKRPKIGQVLKKTTFSSQIPMSLLFPALRLGESRFVNRERRAAGLDSGPEVAPPLVPALLLLLPAPTLAFSPSLTFSSALITSSCSGIFGMGPSLQRLRRNRRQKFLRLLPCLL